jgi:oligopeptide transport system permease protein
MYIIMAMVQIHNFGPRPRIPFFDSLQMALQSYRIYLTNIVTEWNWGYYRGDSVWELFKEKVPITFRINVVVLFAFIFLGIFFGVISALKRHSLLDGIISTITMVLNSIPPIFLIFPAIVIFGYQLEILPPMFPTGTNDLHERLLGYVIPILVLAGPAISNVTRLVRGELIESMDAEYMTLARVKGLTRSQAIIKHGFRNALVSIIPEIPSLFMTVLLSSFFIESIYNIDGLANWYFESFYRRHFGSGYFFFIIPNAMIISIFYAGLVTSLSVITDISLGLVDPRIRMGKK